MNITVLTLYDRISLFHTLNPFLKYAKDYSISYTDSKTYCLEKDRNEILFLVRYFLKPDIVDFELLEKLRAKYKRIIFFNGNAGGGIHRPEVLPYVDLFFNKSLFKDRTLYQKDLYGGELYSDYYHREFSINDGEEKITPPVVDENDLAKLRLSWNVGIGEFPRHKYRQRFGVAAARIFGMNASRPFMRNNRYKTPQNTGEFPMNARLGYQQRESITFQRRLHMEKLEGREGVLTGKVNQKQFNREIHDSQIIYSPFGWGELCFRDFEAVMSGALLIKPDMSHLDTWPDIFIPYETYVPVRWDGEDLVETCEKYLVDEKERVRIARNAWEHYMKQVESLPERVGQAMEEILS
ncbi:MAG: glycosyltransferase [Spirochaetales bacterium]|nr:glycosyltransferase [Spirochaetales bacterium]